MNILLGISISLFSLYAGAYVVTKVLDAFYDEWYGFPTYVIAMLITLFGIVYGIGMCIVG